MELEEQRSEQQVPSPSPASAEGWVCFPESTGPGSGGKCLEGKDVFFLVKTKKKTKNKGKGFKWNVFMLSTFK